MSMDGEVVIPEDLMKKMPPCAQDLPDRKYTWLSNEEVASILVNFNKHKEWMTMSRVYRPENGRLLMFNRKKVRYRQDMYIWKTKRKSKWPREDHVKLKVGGIPCITALYVHSDILPTFHRRCYWFRQNPDVVLVHYLNYPYMDDGNHVIRDLCLNHQCQQWQDLAKEDVNEQLRPMFSKMPWPRADAVSLTLDQGEIIISKLVEKHFLEARNHLDPLISRLNQGLPRNIKPKVPFTDRNIPTSNKNILVNGGHQTAVATYQLIGSPCIGKTIDQPMTVANGGFKESNSNCTVLFLGNSTNGTVHRHVTLQSVSPVTNQCNQKPEGCLNDQSAIQVNGGANHSVISIKEPSIVQTSWTNSSPKTFAPPSVIFTSPLSHPSVPVCSTTKVGFKLESSEFSHQTNNDTLFTNGQMANSGSSPLLSPQIKDDSDTPTTPAQYMANGNKGMSYYAGHPVPDSPSVYGVKDAMVTTCTTVPAMPELSPFSEESIQQTINNGLGLDVFDVESLFNVSNSTSVESSDQANSSTESAVGDLFPQHLWEPNIATSTLGSITPDSGHESVVASSNNQNVLLSNHDILNDLHIITEFSPDWAYTEGGAKILVTGTWINNGEYQCVFGDIAVPATHLQIGVLRCYCPAHVPGHVNLHISCGGQVVSHSVQFEYKRVPSQYKDINEEWLQLDENEFKMSILERLERMEERLNTMGSKGGNALASEDVQMSSRLQHGLHLGLEGGIPGHSNSPSFDFEDRLVNICRRINNVVISTQQSLPENNRLHGLTLLHYSAALGYNKLLNAMRSLRLQSDNAFLQLECDPRNVDKFDCTPLMWASACGQLSCAESLCMWSSAELRSLDVLGRSPASVARQRGHMTICNRLETIVDNQGLVAQEQDEVDDADTSSIGDTTISGTLDTLDSGEDSMETDENMSCGQPSVPTFILGSQQTPCSKTAAPSDHNQYDKENIDWDGERMIIEGNSECVTSLAEQIVEHAPEYIKGDNVGSLGAAADESALTLRNLPQFVNSHCGTNYYPGNAQCTEQGSSLNWSDFLRLPPRDLSTHNVYQNSFELQLDSLRLTEYEQRQLFMAATTVLNAYHCEGLALNSEVLRASLLIKGCYRKYKKFAVSKKMNEAAVLIQSKFRSYQEQKRFQRSRHAAILIQSFYRTYKHARCGKSSSARSSKTVKLIEDALRGHMTKKRQHQAARKIQRFLRQCQYRSASSKKP